jgi:hypothetical protein
MIIDFPNEFGEGKDILETIPEQEYNNLALKITNIIPKLLELGSFTNQGTIEERKQRFILSSNPLSIFLNKLCDRGRDYFISYPELYNAYIQFLMRLKRRIVSRKEFCEVLEKEGLYWRRTSKTLSDGNYERDQWIETIRLKPNWKFVLSTFARLSTTSITAPFPMETKCKTMDNMDNLAIKYIPWDEMALNHLPCCRCGDSPCNEAEDGKNYCIKHFP